MRVFLLALTTCLLFFSCFNAGLAQEIRPWHNLQQIKEIVNDLHDIRHARKIEKPIVSVPVDMNKTPTDVYDRAYVLLEKLKELSTHPGFDGHIYIKLPSRKEGRKIPPDVAPLLQEAKRITDTMRYMSEVDKNRIEVPIQAGMTTPYVYHHVDKAIALVETLL